MRLKDFSKMYGALVIFSIAIILRPGERALEILSQPIIPFALLAFLMHRNSTQRMPHINWVYAGQVALFLSFLINALLPQMNFWLYNLWTVAHLFLGFFYLQLLQKPLSGNLLVKTAIPFLLGWLYLFAFHAGDLFFDFRLILFLLTITLHGVSALFVLGRLPGWQKLLALLTLMWLVADAIELLYPNLKDDKAVKALIYGVRFIALYTTALAPIAIYCNITNRPTK